MALVSRQGARPHRGCGQMAGRQLCTGELCSTSRAPARSRTTGRAQRSQASPPCRTLRQAQAGASSTTSRCNTRSMPSRSRHHRHLAQPRCVRHQVRLRAPGAAPRGHHRCLRVAGHDGGRETLGLSEATSYHADMTEHVRQFHLVLVTFTASVPKARPRSTRGHPPDLLRLELHARGVPRLRLRQDLHERRPDPSGGPASCMRVHGVLV